MVLGIAGLAISRALFAPNPLVIAIQLGAVLLMLWARITFGRRSFHAAANPTAGGLVTTGPYRYIRHPIYTAVCIFTAASLASHFSSKTIAWGALILFGAVTRMLSEEKLLLSQYPEYRQYATTTWRAIPFIF